MYLCIYLGCKNVVWILKIAVNGERCFVAAVLCSYRIHQQGWPDTCEPVKPWHPWTNWPIASHAALTSHIIFSRISFSNTCGGAKKTLTTLRQTRQRRLLLVWNKVLAFKCGLFLRNWKYIYTILWLFNVLWQITVVPQFKWHMNGSSFHIY